MTARFVSVKLVMRIPDDWTEDNITELKATAMRRVENVGEAIVVGGELITYWTEVSK